MTGSPFSSGRVKSGAFSLTFMTKYLYRKATQSVTLATAIVILSFSVSAQFRTPQTERKTPRAVGVLETFKNGSRRLVPVTFFYEKHFYDATFYHATPVPFTLYSETVYEVQQFGKPLGTFTVQSATENSAVWFGNGRFKGLPDPALLAKKHAPPPVVLEDPSKPTLHRRAGSEGDNSPAHPATAANAPEVEEDPDRPKLHRREGGTATDTKAETSASASTATQDSTTQASTNTSTSTTASTKTPASADPSEESSGQDPNRPKLQRKDDSGKAAGGKASPTTTGTSAKTSKTSAPEKAGAPDKSSAPTSASAGSTAAAPTTVSAKVPPAELTPSDDPDHPVLRRGQPVQAQSGRDLPDFKKEEPVSREVAISDAGLSELQSLIYVCPPEERKQLEASARGLAQAELRRLAAQRGIPLLASAKAPAARKTVAAGKTAVSKKALSSEKAAAALPELKLAEEQFVPYDLDYNNYATVVYSARYAPEGAAGAGGKAKGWVVTVVARQDEGKLIKLYSAVSNPRELDLYPELRLVDAVDPDGYGRAALLFREQKRDGVSWLLGRLTGYELRTVFETASR